MTRQARAFLIALAHVSAIAVILGLVIASIYTGISS